MANVFQCDACGAISEKDSEIAVNGVKYDVCKECADKVRKIVEKAPRKNARS